MYLRQSFVTLYVLEDGGIIDHHKHFQQGGFTEHTCFLAATVDSRGFLTPIPQGPKVKALAKKKGKKVKRSERTKAMLKPPGEGSEGIPVASKPSPPPSWDAEAWLPGMASDPLKPAFLSCVGSTSLDALGEECLAATKSGSRCCRKRVTGNYCQQHYDELAQEGLQQLFHNEMEDMFEAAQARFEKQQLDLALKLSLESLEEVKAQRAKSIEIVERRLAEHGLNRVETPRTGDCLFISAAWSAGIPIDPFALRQQVVSYLRTHPSMFSSWFDSKLKDFDSYLGALSRPGVCGATIFAYWLFPIYFCVQLLGLLILACVRS